MPVDPFLGLGGQSLGGTGDPGLFLDSPVGGSQFSGSAIVIPQAGMVPAGGPALGGTAILLSSNNPGSDGGAQLGGQAVLID